MHKSSQRAVTTFIFPLLVVSSSFVEQKQRKKKKEFSHSGLTAQTAEDLNPHLSFRRDIWQAEKKTLNHELDFTTIIVVCCL